MNITVDNWHEVLKVGQIFKHIHGRKKRVYVVTNVPKKGSRVSVISNEGIGRYCWAECFSNYEFLGQYPSWQEAVNSFEFNCSELVK